jgi:hypothetical protein
MNISPALIMRLWASVHSETQKWSRAMIRAMTATIVTEYIITVKIRSGLYCCTTKGLVLSAASAAWRYGLPV